MAESEITAKYIALFKGNMSFYVRHEPPFTVDENGKVKGRWVGIAKDEEHKEILTVTRDKYKEHLQGGDGLAIEPLCEDNKCFFATIDIDVKGVNYSYLVQRMYQYGLKFAPFVSKSAGLHIYFFFRDKEKGSKVIETVNRVVNTFGLNRLYTSDKGKSAVEVFPKHAVIKPGEQGSCVFLPYYNAAGECKQKLITADNTVIGIVKAIAVIEGMFTQCDEISETLDKLPYNDAPYCVQMLALTGALSEGAGRADYLFSAGIYLKKKFRDDFLQQLIEINECFPTPLTEKEVDGTYASVTNKEKAYEGYKCKTGPCAEYCDTKQCRLREFGVGKEKGGHFTGFNCWGEISRIMAEEPYYVWKVQVNEGDPFKEIKIDSASDLMNQLVVQHACVDKLDKAPLRVKENDWIELVNGSMTGIADRQIKIEQSTDTTDISALKSGFINYITHKQVQSNQPYMINMGQVYRKEVDGKTEYYFTTDSLKQYLRIKNVSIGRVNLREELIRYGCTEGDVSYKLGKGNERTIQCWKKASDEMIEKVGTYYEDVLEADKAVVAENKLNKADTDVEGEEHDEDAPRF